MRVPVRTATFLAVQQSGRALQRFAAFLVCGAVGLIAPRRMIKVRVGGG